MSERVNVYRVEVMVIDHDGIGPGEVQAVMESTRYPNRCISPEVMGVETREVDWTDDHPLNMRGRTKDAYRELFAGERYHDSDGNPVTLEKLVRDEPEWAVSQIREARFLRWALRHMVGLECEDVDGHIAHLRQRWENERT
jgi:hypothetical protein